MGLTKWVGLGFFFFLVRERGAQCCVGEGKGSFWSMVYGLGVSLVHTTFCRPGDG